MLFCARKINPEYLKQIKVVNQLNPANAPIVEVRANNIDQQRLTLHSQFYKLSNLQGAKTIIDFETCTLNSPKVRPFLLLAQVY